MRNPWTMRVGRWDLSSQVVRHVGRWYGGLCLGLYAESGRYMAGRDNQGVAVVGLERYVLVNLHLGMFEVILHAMEVPDA